MPPRHLGFSLAALLCALAPAQALAWGDNGHKVVADIAWAYLTPAAHTRISALLSHDRDRLTDNDFASRSTWADKYRDTDRPEGPIYKGTQSWHFVDIPAGAAATIPDAEKAETALCPNPKAPSGHPASTLGQDCVVDKIRQLEAELANPATPATEQIVALKFLIHLVGDIHQPFHAIDHNDHGGNCVTLAAGHRGSMSLHSYWDSQVVTELAGPRSVDRFAKALVADITPAQKAEWQVDDPALWAAQSAVKAREIGYLGLNVKGLPTCDNPNTMAPFKLPIAYPRAARDTAKVQLEKAGVRLAFVLNKIFK